MTTSHNTPNKNRRSDSHAPSTFDPANYTEVGCFDAHPEDGFFSIDNEYADRDYFSGNYENKSRCDHCGAGPLRYGVIFNDKATGKNVVVGCRCAGKLGLSSLNELAIRKTGERIARERKAQAWRDSLTDEQKDAIEWLVAEIHTDGRSSLRGGSYAFGFDLVHKMNRYGDLSEKQVAAIVKMRDRAIEFEARRAAEAEALEAAGPLPEGRIEVEGTIVSTKWQDNDFGGALKMLVRLADGNKVWGTVPGNIQDAVWNEYRERGEAIPEVATGTLLKGRTITMKATVTRSNDDEHFGFFKRPTGTLNPVGSTTEV